MANLGAVWLYLPLENAPGPPTRLIIFDGGVKVDFTICDVMRLSDMARSGVLPPLYERGYRVLIDKDRLAARLPRAPLRPPMTLPPSPEEFTKVIREFWFEVFHVSKYLKREDLWAAKTRDWQVMQQLLPMLVWYEKSLHGWDYETEPSGVRMKEWVEPDIQTRLMCAFASFDAAKSWRALDVTVRLFRDLAQATAVRLGHTYPQELDEHISRYMGFLRGW